MSSVLHKIFQHKRIVIVVAVLIAGLLIFISTRPSAAQQVTTQDVVKKDLTQTLSASGTIDATESVNLNFTSPGKLTYLGIKKGDAVKSGQVIATLDQRIMQKNLEAALRTYSVQRNTFEQTKDDKDYAPPSQDVERQISRILESNQYDLEKAVISVELQSLAKEQSVLTSPITGIVTRADVTSAGVNVGVTTTFSIANPAELIFKMDIDEADVGKVQEGQKVSLLLNAFPDKELITTVDTIDFATHTTTTGGSAYAIESPLPNDLTGKYRLGMTGDAEIELQKKNNVLTIPISSILDEKYVYLKTKDGFEKKEIIIGISNDTETEIVSGLNEGDKVALDPTEAEKIKPKRFIFF